MFILRRYHQEKFERYNAIVDQLYGHLIDRINLVGSATLPFPEICEAQTLPASACRVEGHLGARFYAGTKPMDLAEDLAEEGVRRLFSLDDEYQVSVQPHSATQANHSVWRSILQRGDTISGLSTKHGGHISHVFGTSGLNYSPFPMSGDGIDYDCLMDECSKTRPKLIVAGATSYPLKIDYERLSKVAQKVGAHLHADLAHTAPYVVSRAHPPVIPYCDTITVDTGKGLRGPKGAVLIFKSTLSKSVLRGIFPLEQSSPNQAAIIAKACLFEIWNPESIREYSQRILNCTQILLQSLAETGINLVYPNSDTHLILLDLRKNALSGVAAERILEEGKILVNRNQIPGDEASAQVSSGIRLGTTTLAILNYSKEDIVGLGKIIGKAIMEGKVTNQDTINRYLEKYQSNLAQK